jgi:hypothetical protein
MKLNWLKKSKRFQKDAGIALLTTLLLLFLMSSLLVGFSILLASSQKLAGTNNQQVHAFYAAEAGMEQLTAGLGNLFSQTYSPSITQINALETTPPVIPGIQFITGNGTSGYQITPQAFDANGNPAPTITTIKSGNYQGMTAMATEYVLMTNARTTDNREVTLKRTTQTVGIPMFQFGIFSDNDLSFFPGPNFNFGGRTHTNGNLFLAAGATLSLADKTDAYKDVIRWTLSNGHLTSSGYTGTVNVTLSPGGGSYRALGMSEGSLQGGVGSSGWSGWPNLSMTTYNGNIQNGLGSNAPTWAGSAKQLDLGLVTIGGGSTQSIDLIRRPISAEAPAVTAERYFAQASLRVLLSDDPQDLMNLPCIDGSIQPFDLSKMATLPSTWTTSGYAPLVALYNAMIANNVTPLPLAASGSMAGSGPTVDGYWQPAGFPIIKGFLKIEEQTAYGNPCGTWRDVTVEVLSYGYVGRNIDPVPQTFDAANFTLNPQWAGTTAKMELGAPPNGAYGAATQYFPPNVPLTGTTPVQLGFQNGASLTAAAGSAAQPFPGLFTSANPAGTGTCRDPHPNAVIRLERVRDNPSSVPYTSGTFKNTGTKNLPQLATVAEVCGVDPATGKMLTNLRSAATTPQKLPQSGGVWTPQPSDFWPNTLFDTREGTIRDIVMNGSNPAKPTLNGVMQYIELDGKNVASWFGGKIGTLVTSGQSTKDPSVAPNDFVVYISDRRGNYSKAQTIAGGWPPLSWTKNETGEYGWTDLVNSPQNPATGCPNSGLDTGEDIDATGVLYTYGASQSYIHGAGITPFTSLGNGQLGIYTNLVTSGAISANSDCAAVPTYASDGIWPMQVAATAASARENPPLFFRRAVKIVNASNLTAVGPCPSGVTCGLTIATENPVYIQGDFNANSGGNGWNDPYIPSSVAGDAVTLLSDNWNDMNSFSSPYVLTARAGNTSWYRAAIIGGATLSFPQPSGMAQDYGTDGGVHNFLRYLEAWSGTLWYQGSIIDLYASRQANSTFKCCTTVYGPPSRGYNFDTSFLNPTLLPPRTPLFRDVNTTGWTRLLLPGQYD